MKALHRFMRARNRKFCIFLREILLDFENRHQETRMGNFMLRKIYGVVIGKNTIIDSHVIAGKNVIIGNNVLIRQNCVIGSDVVIEDDVVMSPGVNVITSGHNPSTMEVVHKPVKICKGAWVATNAIILPGATIGKGACVAAGAVVCGGMFVPDHVIVAGIPAKVIKIVK